MCRLKYRAGIGPCFACAVAGKAILGGEEDDIKFKNKVSSMADGIILEPYYQTLPGNTRMYD